MVLVLVFTAYSWEEADELIHRIRTQQVTTMDPGNGFKCGLPPNQYIILADGTQLCARYRDPHFILLHGKWSLGTILKFYFTKFILRQRRNINSHVTMHVYARGS